MTQRDQLKLLLIQIRQHKQVKDEELRCFSEFAGLDECQFDILDVFATPDFDPSIADSYKGVFVGGASEASVLKPDKYPFVPSSMKLMNYCIENDIPTFASCFGFQLAVLALGSSIYRSTDEFEMGSYQIQLTPDASDDPVFRGIPDGFWAISVHQEYTDKAPEGCTALAYTPSCLHAFKVNNKPFWAFQFHPEVDKSVLIHRLGVYQETYTESSDHFEQVVKSCKDTPEANRLVRNFVDRVLL